MVASGKETGFHYDHQNSRLDFYYGGTRVGALSAAGLLNVLGLGYGAGSGGAVTQATNRTTAVTLNTLTGQITTNGASLAAGAEADFVVNNNQVAATDVVVICAASGQTADTSVPHVTAVAAGQFTIQLTNLHATTADTGAMVINFAVIKGASS